MIDWNFYCKRRGINLVNFIIRNNIESYEHLVEYLENKDVQPPEKGEFQAAYAIALPPIPTKQEVKEKPVQEKKTPAKKTTTRKRRSKKTSG